MKKVALWLLAAAAFLLTACGKDEPQPLPPGPDVPDVFQLENAVVRSYLDFLEQLPYKDSDYSYSYIDDYYLLTTIYRKDRPLPARVSWQRGSGTQRLYIADNPDFTETLSYPVGALTESYEIYNLIPGRQYWWKVVSSASSNVVGEGTFRTEGRRRFLSIDNICNVRDLGGIPTADGSRRIKFGLLFRGGEMNGYHQDYEGRYTRLGESGKSEMLRFGIRADLDMRTASEALGITESPLGPEIDYIRFETANNYYYDKFWLADDYIRALQWTIDELRKGKPVFFHCIYGADRTGTMAFLMEALLGVNENHLAIDYELTSFSYGLESAPRRRGPRNELSVYRYRQMVEGLRSSVFEGSTLQQRVYNFFLNGYPYAPKKTVSISADDLDWFISTMLEEV